MNRPAFVFPWGTLYWHGIVLAAAVLLAAVCFAVLRKKQGGRPAETLRLLPAALLFGLLFSRLVFWNYMRGMFDSFFAAFSPKSLASGGYSLPGAFLGALLGIYVFCRLNDRGSMKKTLDAAAAAGALGVALGRLSALFSADDLGQSAANERLHFFPVCVFDSDMSEWRQAVFAWESLAAFVIFIILLEYFRSLYVFCRCGRVKLGEGDIFLLFLLYYGCSQCILESFRSDSIFFNYLGLVRVSQVAALIMLFAALLVFCIQLSRGGVKLKHVGVWAVLLGLLAAAFIMELTLSANVLLLNYSVMGGCLLAVAVIGTLLCSSSCSEEK